MPTRQVSKLISAYADLVRLTGHDPVTEILAKLRVQAVTKFGDLEVCAVSKCSSIFIRWAKRRCVHFSHGTGTMHLHRNLAQPQLGSYLLIQLSGCYSCDHFSLTAT